MKRRGGGGDGLSSLPNEVITRILSILPTKDAAVTTVFSDKIKPAFSALTNIELDDSPISHCMYTPTLDERTPNFKKYVDYVLQHCQEAEKLDSFTLRFGRFHGDPQRYVVGGGKLCWSKGQCYQYLEPDRLNAWISFPLARGVRELELCINVQKSPESRHLLRSVFLCESLEILKLDSNLDLDIFDPRIFPFRLPHLKQLHLRSVIIIEDDLLTLIVERCPVLEDLLVDCYWECGDLLFIDSPSLLKLDLCFNKCNGDKHTDNVFIRTPNLQSFKYQDFLAERYTVVDMPSLVVAEISMTCELWEERSCWNLCTILKACSFVSQLSLLYNSITV